MTGRRARGWLVGVGILLLVGIISVVPAFIGSNGGLINRARRITDAPAAPYDLQFDTDRRTRFFWRSENEVLEVELRSAADNAYLIDARTGAKKPVPQLDAGFREVFPSGEMHLSPDRKWLLWNGRRTSPRSSRGPIGGGSPLRHRGLSRPPLVANITGSYTTMSRGRRPGRRAHGLSLNDEFRIVATELDGPRKVNYHLGECVAWERDSRNWVRLLWTGRWIKGPGLQRQGLDLPMPSGLPVTGIPVSPVVSVQGMRTEQLARAFCRLLGVTPNNHALAAIPEAPQSQHRGGTVWFYDISLSPGAPSRAYQVNTPGNPLFLQDIALSPDGERIAWKLSNVRISPMAELLRHVPFFPRVGAPMRVIGLWVSRLDGSDMHAIGEEEIVPPMRDTSLYDLTWTPDGKKLSFVYNQALYTIPAQ